MPSAAPVDAVLDWTRAGIVVGVSDARGALADATLTMNEKTVTFVPAGTIGDPNAAQGIPLAYFGVREAGIAQPNAVFRVTAAPALLRRATDCGSGLWQNHPLSRGG